MKTLSKKTVLASEVKAREKDEYVFAEYDKEKKKYCLIGNDSGYCYKEFDTKAEAEEAEEKLSKELVKEDKEESAGVVRTLPTDKDIALSLESIDKVASEVESLKQKYTQGYYAGTFSSVAKRIEWARKFHKCLAQFNAAKGKMDVAFKAKDVEAFELACDEFEKVAYSDFGLTQALKDVNRKNAYKFKATVAMDDKLKDAVGTVALILKQGKEWLKNAKLTDKQKQTRLKQSQNMRMRWGAMSSVEMAYQIPDWFKEMPKAGQDKYLKDHPNSKLAKTYKRKQKGGGSTSLAPAGDKADSKPKHKEFKGPQSKKEAIGDDPRKERKIVSMMDKLAKMAADAKVKGEAAPNYDLCKVSIPGTNLFCKVNKGIPRKLMPQLKGEATPGSWADKNLKKDAKGEVDGEAAFKAMLKETGRKLTPKSYDVSQLKATQTDLVGAKVAGMLQGLKKDPKHPGITAPIYVSKDGYILDGHHRWAAMVGLAMADGSTKPVNMDVIEVDMGIEDLVEETNAFVKKIGIPPKEAKTKAEAARLNGYKGCCG